MSYNIRRHTQRARRRTRSPSIEKYKPIKVEYGRGYDFDLVNEEQKVSDLECTICHLLLRDAHSTPCHHAFCHGCLVKWNNEQPTRRRMSTRCPSCNVQYDPDKISFNGVVDRMVKTSIDVKCPQHEKGCQWQGKIIDYKDHEEKCDYEMIRCKNKGCQENVARLKMNYHEGNCGYRRVECDFCCLEMSAREIENHHGECPFINVECPNDECQLEYLRQEIPKHLAEECLYEKIACEYSDVGCNQKVQRKDMEEHNKINLAKHQKLMLHDYKLMKMKVAEVERSNKELRDELKKANEKKPQSQKPVLKNKFKSLYVTESEDYVTESEDSDSD
ncbi:TNF receptor-associated factor 6-like [Clytia hemisphaerica]|uniref:Uncharacterized protein n=1 Tax=Clytia hemisphaerica TaxID=252671 RepID=A0A7M5XC98_9CNID